MRTKLYTAKGMPSCWVAESAFSIITQKRKFFHNLIQINILFYDEGEMSQMLWWKNSELCISLS